MNSKPTVTTVLCLLVLVLASSLLTARSSVPQEKPGSMNVSFNISEADKTLRGHPAMISLISGGQVVEQQETSLPNGKGLFGVRAGVYDVRVESEGMVTEIKRGVHVFPDRQLDLNFVPHAGKGVHIVEYATGGLSREEVAARLAKLEAAVSELQKSIPPK